VTRRKSEQAALPLDEAVGEVCEVCGEGAQKLSARHGGAGLRSCFRCVTLSSAEVAVLWLRKIRRVVER